MKLQSSAFGDNQPIPPQYTCKGAGGNPPLAWSDIPEGAITLALIMHDPDAPAGDWTHWVVWNISPQTIEIKANTVPLGAEQGVSGSGIIGYEGPCPPSGLHHYMFELYAVDTHLTLAAGANRQQVQSAIQNHVITTAVLVGTFSK